MVYLLVFLLSFTVGTNPSQAIDRPISVEAPHNKGYLTTGFYNITDQASEYEFSSYGYERIKENGEEKTIKKHLKQVYLNPVPILTPKHFAKLKVHKSAGGSHGLKIQLTDAGKKAWEEATQTQSDKFIAFVFQNKLLAEIMVTTPVVNGKISCLLPQKNKKEVQEVKSIVLAEKKLEVQPTPAKPKKAQKERKTKPKWR